MKLRTIVCALALSALATPATAETPKPTAPGAAVKKSSPQIQALPAAKVIEQKATSVDPKAAAIGNKAAVLTINPSVLRSLEPAEREPEVDRVDASYEEFKTAKASMVRTKISHSRKLRQCSIQSYSAADQSAAGCEASDTVAECSRKLLLQCSRSSYMRYLRARRVLVAKAVALQRTVDNVTSIYVP